MSRRAELTVATSPAPRTSDLRKQGKRAIDRLSGVSLRLAIDFLAYMQERHSDAGGTGGAASDATDSLAASKELLDIPGFADSMARGVKDARDGRVKSWRKVRRDV